MALQSPAAVRMTAFCGPLGGWKTTVTTWSATFVDSGEPASQLRSVTSSRSPGAANGRLVAPSAALKVIAVPGIRLQPACACSRPARLSATWTNTATPTPAYFGMAFLPRFSSVHVSAEDQVPCAPRNGRQALSTEPAIPGTFVPDRDVPFVSLCWFRSLLQIESSATVL